MKVTPFFILALLAAICLSACTSLAAPSSTPEFALIGTLRPYPSKTPTPSPYPSNYITASLTPTPTAIATPVYYAIREADDMFGISLRYGISLEALRTANPSVNPYAMGVGTALLIPITPTVGSTPTATPTAPETPAPIGTITNGPQTDCYRDSSGGITCFVLVTNASEKPLENLSVIISLKDNQSDYSLSQTAILPLNILPARQSLPLITYFQAPTPQDFSASATIDFSLPVLEEDKRYLEVQISTFSTNMAADKLSANISGEVNLSDPDESASSVWVLAVAYAPDGRVVGIRRWEAQPPIPTDLNIPFSLNIYSLGPAIDRVELYAEARPTLP